MTKEQISEMLFEIKVNISDSKLEKITISINSDLDKINLCFKEKGLPYQAELDRVTKVNNDISWAWDFKIHINCFIS